MAKKCFKCGVEKELTEFYKHPRMADGHLNKCKECAKKDVQERYDTQTDKIKEYEKKRFQTPERKAKAIEYQRNRRARNVLKTVANYKVSSALKTGRLKPAPCEVCGELKTEAHHYDYTKPLDVRWLCRKHHLKEHGKNHWETTA